MDKILLLGANGQVGWELQRSLTLLGEVNVCGKHEANFENLEELGQLVDDYQPTIIVNAAAYTAVDKAESEPERVAQINAVAVKLLAQKAKQLNAWLVHYSTDYIFDGSNSVPYKESDKPNPQSVYGVTKLQGEKNIQEVACKHLIFRTSWVYAARGANFAKTMIKLAKERDELKVINDQIGAPASAELIADITSLCLFRVKQDSNSKLSGLYNLVPDGEVSWFGFAKYVITLAEKYGVNLKVTPENIQPIPTTDYPTSAKRPMNSRLDVNKIKDAFGVNIPHWKTHVHRLIEELYTEGPA
ncbi:MAG: dTDP-4-dehydrorhamnose reductase [Woeseiaceae bacterium]